MGLFDGKKGLILGVANDHSIAWAIAQSIMAEGGAVRLHAPARPAGRRAAAEPPPRARCSPSRQANAKFLVPLDVQQGRRHRGRRSSRAKSEFGKIDFLLHSIAFASLDDLKRDTIETSRDGLQDGDGDQRLQPDGGRQRREGHHVARGPSILTLTYFGGERSVPGYNVMGICKAALDCSMKYLAYDLGPRGIRVNALSAGPAADAGRRGPSASTTWGRSTSRSPRCGKNVTHEEVGRVGAFLLSDMSDGITGEILHVDGGYNVMGSPGRMLERLKAGK